MPKVLISDKLSPLALEVFQERGIEVRFEPTIEASDLASCIGEYEGLAVRSRTQVTAAILEAGSKLKVVGRAGIGTDNIDTRSATRSGIAVMNTPFGNAVTTAEHAITMLMSLARQIPAANASTQAGKWEKSAFMGVEVTGKTLGIIGCGNIGAIVANRAHGLHLKVMAYDPYLNEDRAAEIGVQKVDLDTLLRSVDFVTMHVPLNDNTRHMIDADAIGRMKPGVRIINCARGGLIVEEDLKTALDSGHVAGAALDVFETEPAHENPLFGHPNLICTPHLGASTNEAQVNVAVQLAEQMSDYLLTGAIQNAINMPAISADEAPRLRPFLHLGEQLGALAAQIADGAPRTISITYDGQAAELDTRPVTSTIVSGLLSEMVDQVNLISAPQLARDHGIFVQETRTESSGDYVSLVRVSLETDTHSVSVAGTLLHGDRPRIVDVTGVPLEAELGAHMLFINNKDKPGLIGGLGSTLADAGINIATFNLGRTTPGGDAVALVSLDQEIPPEVLTQVAQMPSVASAKALAFPI